MGKAYEMYLSISYAFPFLLSHVRLFSCFSPYNCLSPLVSTAPLPPLDAFVLSNSTDPEVLRNDIAQLQIRQNMRESELVWLDLMNK